MHTAKVECFDIYYWMDVSCPTGYVLTSTQMFAWTNVDAVLIQPTGHITITAAGTIQLLKDPPGDCILKLGFVQSLVECSRVGLYSANPNIYYKEVHKKYPVKDGSGKPWYQDDPANLLEVNVKEERQKGNRLVAFKIEITDEPHCSFPTICYYPSKGINQNLPLLGVKFHDAFKTCLMAEIYRTDRVAQDQVPDQRAFLHEVSWNFNVEASYRPGRPGHLVPPAHNGYHHGGPGLAIPYPYATPAMIELGGGAANVSKVCQLAYVPKIIWKHG